MQLPSIKKMQFGFPTNAQIAFWGLLFLFLLYMSSLSMGIGLALNRAVLIFICHLLNFYLVFSFLTPRFFEKRKYLAFATGVIWLLLLLTPLRLWLEKGFAANSAFYGTRRNMPGLVLFSEISIVAFASLLRIAVSANMAKGRMAEMEKLNLETELKFLKSQMSPHFLFNTINNVYALAMDKSDKAPEALLKLSGLLRYFLYECNHQVPVQKELDALAAYIELFSLRFEDPLNITFVSGVKNTEVKIEPMLLIPLAENAVKHSALGVIPDAFVEILLVQETGGLKATVRNSKSAIIKEDDAGGLGLQNIRKRLAMLRPDDGGLRITETETEFEVVIKIPGQ